MGKQKTKNKLTTMCRDECFTNHSQRLQYSYTVTHTLTHSLAHSIVSIKMGKSIFERDRAVVAEAEAEPNRWVNDWMVTVSKIMYVLSDAVAAVAYLFAWIKLTGRKRIMKHQRQYHHQIKRYFSWQNTLTHTYKTKKKRENLSLN